MRGKNQYIYIYIVCIPYFSFLSSLAPSLLYPERQGNEEEKKKRERERELLHIHQEHGWMKRPDKIALSRAQLGSRAGHGNMVEVNRGWNGV